MEKERFGGGLPFAPLCCFENLGWTKSRDALSVGHLSGCAIIDVNVWITYLHYSIS